MPFGERGTPLGGSAGDVASARHDARALVALIRLAHQGVSILSARCSVCGLPPMSCICATLVPCESAAYVTVVMPVREQRKTTNSGKLLCAALTRSELV